MSPPTWPRDSTSRTLIDAIGARRGLRPDRGRDRARVRRAPADQLRLRPADHDRRLRARFTRGLARRRSRPASPSLVAVVASLVMERVGLPAAADAPPVDDARRHLRARYLLQNARAAPATRTANRAARRSVGSLAGSTRRPTIGSLHIRWVTFVAIGAGAVSLGALALLLNRTSIGLQMRAAASMDFRTARLLGVRADTVIMAAVASAACSPPSPRWSSRSAAPGHDHDRPHETIFVLVGVVAGGIDQPGLGDARRLRDRLRDLVPRLRAPRRPERRRSRPTSTCRRSSTCAVIVVLLLRPAGLFARARPGIGGAGMRRARRLGAARARSLLVVAPRASPRRLFVTAADQVKYLTAIVSVAIVAALYVFVGNSGVISFGQVSFVAVGGFAAGVMTIPSDVKPGVLPDPLPAAPRPLDLEPWSLVLAAGAGRRLRASSSGSRLMRLSGHRGRHRHLRGARHHLQPPLPTGTASAPAPPRVADPRDRPTTGRRRSARSR